MTWFPKRLLPLALICFGLMAFHTPALGVELTFPAVEIDPGGGFEMPVMVDGVENLAGVKLSLSYDQRVLTFKKAEKTRATTSLMHIVNDKKPGVLIIVMAGARGIKGKKFPLLRLSFEAKTPDNLPHETKIEVKEIQLMSDQLKDLPAKIVSRPILIRIPEKPVKTEKSAEAEKSPDTAPKASESSEKAVPEANDAPEKTVPTDADLNSEKAPESSDPDF